MATQLNPGQGVPPAHLLIKTMIKATSAINAKAMAA